MGGEEWADVDIEISVLSPLKRIERIDEIEVGVHGIIIEKGFHTGLLLPQVATENNWDRNTFIEYTCYKAGLPKDAWKSMDTVIYIFSARSFRAVTPEECKDDQQEMCIEDIVKRYPKTILIFERYGLGCVGCEAALFENVAQGAEIHGVDVNVLIADLNTAISEG